MTVVTISGEALLGFMSNNLRIPLYTLVVLIRSNNADANYLFSLIIKDLEC